MKQFITVCVVCFIIVAVPAFAETVFKEIDHWENGFGITQNGERITDGWGYDEKSAAGKYVLFDAEGRVRQKKDSLQQSLPAEEQFTDTETENGVVALRGNVFTGFEGRIYVAFIQKGNGPAKGITLTKGRMYLENIVLPDGVYEISARAFENDTSYRVICSQETLQIEKGMALRLDITVEDRQPEVENSENPVYVDSEDMEVSQKTNEKERQDDLHKKEDTPAEPMPIAAFFILMGAVAGYGVYRFRKGGKNGKGRV